MDFNREKFVHPRDYKEEEYVEVRVPCSAAGWMTVKMTPEEYKAYLWTPRVYISRSIF
jgi:hypothetical protein